MTNYIPEIKISVSFDKILKKSELMKITSSRDAYNIFKRVFNADTFDWCEEVLILCLNNSNKVIGFHKVSSGGMTGTIVDVRMIFTTALNCLATSLIIAHNHPSGTLQPSEADKMITKKIKEAGEFLDIKLLDHLIITDESFFSFIDEGIF
ncbi:MAG: JAB domain-containing protein [Flavobacteriaceae bacterium]|nr:JAB domain-containing protein [Flavobacteriaceae bacterium]